MKFFKSFACVSLFTISFCIAQNKDITLEDIWGGAFFTEKLEALHSMKNGKHYSVLNFNRNSGTSAIDIYDYKTLSKIKTLLNSADISSIQYFTDYIFSNDESKIILATNKEPIFRHSKLGHYYVYDIASQSVSLIAEDKIQEPTFSPDGTKIAYGLNNNLYVRDLTNQSTTQITFDGEKNKIINGITDWVYEEEFAFVRAFEWNAGSDKIAFIKFDETDVPNFSMDVYGANLYQTQQVFKYPKAGEANSKVSLHFYDINLNNVKTLNINRTDDFYIPRLIANPYNADEFLALISNRHQNKVDIHNILVEDKQLVSNVLLSEKDDAYVEIKNINIEFIDANRFLLNSEKDGYRHIYLHDSKHAGQLKQLTKGNWEVTNYYGFDKNKNTIYYQSVENGSINRDVYSINLNGKNKTRLTTQEGTNKADFSADFTYFINTFSSATIPPKYTLHKSTNGDLVKPIKDNKALAENLQNYKIPQKEFTTINVNGNELNMWMIKPSNFDASKQYPLLMYQYSGPGSQKVANTWNTANDYWHQLIAQQDIIVVCIDGRGTGFKGADFKKVTQKELGKYEVEDQIEAAKKLGRLPYIDASRMGIWGWSYGGFMSSNALFKGSDVFKMAIAVAPVTSWRFYDTIYTERYMTTPQENASGYDDNSPINHVDKLKGEFLLIHGSGDDNVHVQNTMRMVEALIQADKQFEWMVYPDKNHGIYGGNTRLHLYKKMTNFINSTLGNNPKALNKNEVKTIKIKG